MGRAKDLRARLKDLRTRLMNSSWVARLMNSSWFRVADRVQEGLMDDDVSLIAGGLSFFGFLSLAPTLLIAAVCVGWILGAERATAEVVAVSESALGPEGSAAISMLLDPAALATGSGWVATGALLTSLYAASRVFAQLQQALNRTWRVRPLEDQTWRQKLGTVAKKRLLSVAVVLVVGLLILASVILKTILGAILAISPGILVDARALLPLVEFSVSTLLITAVLGTVYQVLPDVDLRFRDVAIAAFVAAMGLQLGTKLLSWYLVRFAATSLSGAAATIIVTLLWLYVTAWIVLAGAELAAAIKTVKEQPVAPVDSANPIIPPRVA